MVDLFDTLYPLANVGRNDLANLCEALWNWKPCEDWVEEKDCQSRAKSVNCSCLRADRLDSFFDFYREVTAFYVPELDGNSTSAIKNHDELIEIIKLIRRNAHKTRLQLTLEHFNQTMGNGGSGTTPDETMALSIAVRVMVMMQSSVEGQEHGLLEAGTFPTIWRDDTSFSQFIDTAIPKRKSLSIGLRENDALGFDLPLEAITAKRLIKVAKLKIIPTNDLRNHLLLDEKMGTVSVYHYTSVLKEHLADEESTPEGSPTTILPKQLASETLNTIHQILFPVDQESQSILRTLVAKNGFDPDICRVTSSSTPSPATNTITYDYWASRLMTLHDELRDPTPRGLLWTWAERRSSARHVMIATLAGVAFAVLLGILGLGVSIFQAWVGWQQWKHPVGG